MSSNYMTDQQKHLKDSISKVLDVEKSTRRKMHRKRPGGQEVWPDHLLSLLMDGLIIFSFGRRSLLNDFGRNELISAYLLTFGGCYRHHKQVGSKLQHLGLNHPSIAALISEGCILYDESRAFLVFNQIQHALKPRRHSTHRRRSSAEVTSHICSPHSRAQSPPAVLQFPLSAIQPMLTQANIEAYDGTQRQHDKLRSPKSVDSPKFIASPHHSLQSDPSYTSPRSFLSSPSREHFLDGIPEAKAGVIVPLPNQGRLHPSNSPSPRYSPSNSLALQIGGATEADYLSPTAESTTELEWPRRIQIEIQSPMPRTLSAHRFTPSSPIQFLTSGYGDGTPFSISSYSLGAAQDSYPADQRSTFYRARSQYC